MEEANSSRDPKHLVSAQGEGEKERRRRKRAENSEIWRIIKDIVDFSSTRREAEEYAVKNKLNVRERARYLNNCYRVLKRRKIREFKIGKTEPQWSQRNVT